MSHLLLTRRDVSKLIQCGDHSLAPWPVTCVHICDGTATEVVPVLQPEGSEVEADWLCRECFDKHFGDEPDSGDISDLRVVCIHCRRKALKPYQENVGSETPQG